jgi:hypothetical protein
MGANISWARTFHGREHFMGENISWARIFLMCANKLHVSKYFGYAQIFQDVRAHIF